MAGEKHAILAELESLVSECRHSLDQASSLEGLEEARIAFLGRKGRLAAAMAEMAGLSKENRPEVGRKANDVKAALTELLESHQSLLNRNKADAKVRGFDPSVPPRSPWGGSMHPVSLVTQEICDVFKKLGFDIVSGPEVENDWHNFEALNIPPDHPARDMQDTLYVTDNILLRTHTSPLQVRTMLEQQPPVAVIAPGKVYRRDSDLTHTPMFDQIEGLLVDTKTTMSDLRGILRHMCREVFNTDIKLRFRPSFFPFTEPSAEVDISCVMCGGKGTVGGKPCRVCKQTGWIEILGCGMVDPNVYGYVGYDPDKYVGWAFGLGVERVAMLKYGIGDLRMFFENDVRFLRQFS